MREIWEMGESVYKGNATIYMMAASGSLFLFQFSRFISIYWISVEGMVDGGILPTT